MSRVANNPVNVPDNVQVLIAPELITVKGPLGELTQELKGDVKIENADSVLTFSALKETKHSKAMSGTLRALVNNMVIGVSAGFERKLTLVGVGYRASAQGNKINLES